MSGRSLFQFFKDRTYKKELARKSLHLPGLFFLYLGKDHRTVSISLLGILIVLYLLSFLIEKQKGQGLPFIATLTHLLKRNGGKARSLDLGLKNLDLGPPCLALGILISLLFLPFYSAACVVWQICLADAVASLAGKGWGKTKIFYSPKKTYLGSLCFFLTAFLIQLPYVPPQTSLLLSLLGTALESLPFGDFDNLLIPFSLIVFYRVYPF